MELNIRDVAAGRSNTINNIQVCLCSAYLLWLLCVCVDGRIWVGAGGGGADFLTTSCREFTFDAHAVCLLPRPVVLPV